MPCNDNLSPELSTQQQISKSLRDSALQYSSTELSTHFVFTNGRMRMTRLSLKQNLPLIRNKKTAIRLFEHGRHEKNGNVWRGREKTTNLTNLTNYSALLRFVSFVRFVVKIPSKHFRVFRVQTNISPSPFVISPHFPNPHVENPWKNPQLSPTAFPLLRVWGKRGQLSKGFQQVFNRYLP